MKMDLQNILQQAKLMQQEIERMRAEVSKKTVTVETGGGMVGITINGANEVLQIKLSKEVVNPDDIEMLEDLILAAINKAIDSAKEMVNEELSKLTGLQNFPNIPFGL